MVDWINEIVPRVKKILEYRREQGVPTATLRGIFYILVSEGLIENLPQPYKRLSEVLVKARRQEIIPYEWITDENRAIINVADTYHRPEKYIKDTLESLMDMPDTFAEDYLPMWYNQPKYVECWVEKNAMAGVMSSILRDSRQVRVVPNGGWSSETFRHDNLERLRTKKYVFDSEERIEDQEKYPDDYTKWRHIKSREVVVLYFGDYDPTGVRMVKNIQEDVENIGATFERVAITREQIVDYNLEHLKTNITPEVLEKLQSDPNMKSFKRDNEGQLFQIELDALNALSPEDFITLLENSVDNHFDSEIHNNVMNDKKYAPATIRKQLKNAVKDFDRLEKEFRKNKKDKAGEGQE